ncbi:MAG TPA: TetR/AcrR family transcriptional regulator [Anaerovoracaceae bacterium]|nr:TetR/AcrR family transcriptional regulator [Anaerovoracaceae bacterium]
MKQKIINQPIKGKREIILEVSCSLFFSKGYKSTKIIEIAEAANIGKGTFYEYFKSKEALFFELLNTKFEMDKQMIEEIASSNISQAEKIKSFFQFEIESMENNGASNNVLAQEMISPGFCPSDEIMCLIHKMFIHKYNFLKNVITQGIKKGEFNKVEPALATTALLGSISFYTAFKFNIMNHDVFTNIPFGNPDWNNEEFFRLILNGLT